MGMIRLKTSEAVKGMARSISLFRTVTLTVMSRLWWALSRVR